MAVGRDRDRKAGSSLLAVIHAGYLARTSLWNAHTVLLADEPHRASVSVGLQASTWRLLTAKSRSRKTFTLQMAHVGQQNVRT